MYTFLSDEEVDGEAFLSLPDDEFENMVKKTGPRTKLKVRRNKLLDGERNQQVGLSAIASYSD